MTIRQAATGLGTSAAAGVVILAGAAIWILMSDPLAVAGAISDGDTSALVMAVVKMLARGLARLAFGR